MKRRDILKAITTTTLAAVAPLIAKGNYKPIRFKGSDVTMTVGGEPLKGIKTNTLLEFNGGFFSDAEL